MGESVQSKQTALRLIAQHQDEIKARGVRRLGLFGSFVRGEQRPESDIDFLVDFQPGKKNFDNFIQLVFILEGLLGRRVELVTAESLSPYLRPYILNEVEYVAFTG